MENQLKRISTAMALLALGCGAAWAQTPKAWSLSMPSPTLVKAAGEYRSGDVVMNLETFSALCLEPSSSATFQVATPATRMLTKASSQNHMIVHEKKAALKVNPNKEPFYSRAEGAISAFAWIDGKMSNMLLSGEVNTDGGPAGKGSFSRQGLMARWDQGNNFYWFYVDFANGAYGIIRSRFFGVMANLPGSTGALEGFKNTNSYFLEFELQGDTVQGRVYKQTPAGGKGDLVADTGKVQDTDPFLTGISGYLAEIALEKPFEPLHGSFGQLSAESR